MNVYIESNFVLEQALEQEQSESCGKLIELARTGAVHVLIPAFSLAEPHIALMHKGNERSRLIPELRKQLSELGRSRPYRTASSDFAELTALLIDSVESERTRLRAAADAIIDAAEIIPLNVDVFREAKGFQAAYDMSFQDSLVLASVVRHLRQAMPEESCFLNRNTKDFADPNIQDMLDEFRCKFFGRFDDALGFIGARIRSQWQ
jgi:hypothetical protein